VQLRVNISNEFPGDVDADVASLEGYTLRSTVLKHVSQTPAPPHVRHLLKMQIPELQTCWLYMLE
jgi:hypothetical protein